MVTKLCVQLVMFLHKVVYTDINFTLVVEVHGYEQEVFFTMAHGRK